LVELLVLQNKLLLITTRAVLICYSSKRKYKDLPPPISCTTHLTVKTSSQFERLSPRFSLGIWACLLSVQTKHTEEVRLKQSHCNKETSEWL
jgi:hypothetical protein